MLFHFVIEGNLASDPTVRTTPQGDEVTHFRLIHNTSYRNSNGQWVDGKYPTSIDVSCWRRLADNVKRLRKGDPVMVELQNIRGYRGGQNGQFANIAGDARSVAVSMRTHPAASLRQRKQPSGDTIRTADGELYAVEDYQDTDDPWAGTDEAVDGEVLESSDA